MHMHGACQAECAHLDLKHGKVVAGAHAAARAKGDEGACPAPLLTQPSVNTQAHSCDAEREEDSLAHGDGTWDALFVAGAVGSYRGNTPQSTSQRVADK